MEKDERVASSHHATSALAAHVDGYGHAVNVLNSYEPKNALSELLVAIRACRHGFLAVVTTHQRQTHRNPSA